MSATPFSHSSRVDVRLRAEAPLPRRDLVAHAGLAAEREHGRAVLLGHRVAARRRVGQEHERAGGRVDVSPSSSKRARPREHDVHLLVVAALLGVVLDHVLAGVAASRR